MSVQYGGHNVSSIWCSQCQLNMVVTMSVQYGGHYVQYCGYNVCSIWWSKQEENIAACYLFFDQSKLTENWKCRMTEKIFLLNGRMHSRIFQTL